MTCKVAASRQAARLLPGAIRIAPGARQWRFEPAKLEGKPVKVYYVLTINFTLKR
jgi:Gram-negative bacterial TonB protein C-terminal